MGQVASSTCVGDLERGRSPRPRPALRRVLTRAAARAPDVEEQRPWKWLVVASLRVSLRVSLGLQPRLRLAVMSEARTGSGPGRGRKPAADRHQVTSGWHKGRNATRCDSWLQSLDPEMGVPVRVAVARSTWARPVLTCRAAVPLGFPPLSSFRCLRKSKGNNHLLSPWLPGYKAEAGTKPRLCSRGESGRPPAPPPTYR